jgi:dUTP pyrophosphatase
MKIPCKKLRENAILPTRGTALAAGVDLYALLPDGQESAAVAPQGKYLFPTGIAVEIPEGYVGLVFARSGIATKRQLAPANCVGVIDADYRGECTVALHNDTDEVRTVAPGDRIAQLVILPFLAAEFAEADALDETDRGAGGFGSTGR